MNDEHPEHLDAIADALANPALGDLFGMDDHRDELVRRGDAIALCDSCDWSQWTESRPAALDALVEHWGALMGDDGLVDEDCDSASYVLTMVGDELIAEHHTALTDVE